MADGNRGSLVDGIANELLVLRGLGSQGNQLDRSRIEHGVVLERVSGTHVGRVLAAALLDVKIRPLDVSAQ